MIKNRNSRTKIHNKQNIQCVRVEERLGNQKKKYFD